MKELMIVSMFASLSRNAAAAEYSGEVVLPAFFTLLICHTGVQAVDESPQADADPPNAADNAWQLPAGREDFHVFLLMGQSNMAGGSREPDGGMLPEDEVPIPHVLFVKTNVAYERIVNNKNAE